MNLYVALVDFQKVFDRVPQKLLWWALRVVGVSKWSVKVVQAMYVGARSRTRVNTFLVMSLSQSWGAPGITITSAAVHRSPGSTLSQISRRISMGNPLCR